MVVNMRSIAIAAAIISGFAASENLVAATCTTSVAYQASGGFGANVISGPDGYELAGEPFSISLYACETKVPSKTGPNYAAYTGLVLKGTVHSRLLTTGFPISTDNTSFVLAKAATPSGYDTIQLSGTVIIQGASIAIKGNIALPAGTLTTTSISTFPSTSIVTAKSQFTYQHSPWKPNTVYATGVEILDSFGNAQKATTGGTSGTTAPAFSETVGGTVTDNTVVWTCEGSAAPTNLAVIGTVSSSVYTPAAISPRLHTDAVQVITAHADGTQHVRSLRSGPVDPAAAAVSDSVMLQFYASGVRDASELHVRIGGQEVPVLYSGAAGHFPGLDEVTVEVPRSLAGMGDVDVVLTADGQTASPVHIHIQ